jgi:HK97 family phage major capsid protein
MREFSVQEAADEVKQIIADRFKAHDVRILDLEQKGARHGGEAQPFEMKSWGTQFVERAADELKAFSEDTNRPRRLRLDMKAITSATAYGGGYSSVYTDQTVVTPQRRLRVRDLLPTIRISTSQAEYAKQTTRTNNANTVAETLQKPESNYAFEMKIATPKVIAHWVPASRQILDDNAQLQGLIDSELRYGLALKEDAQLIAGDGQGENLTGLVTNATPYVAPFTLPGMTMIDQVGLAILQCTLNDFEPTGIIMHPSDCISLLKDSAQGYLITNPVTGQSGANGGQPALFGIPVVPTTSIAVDKFLVGDFQRAATLYDRWEPRVEISTEHADFFTRNMVAILAEQRLALAIKQAGALIYGDFGNVA